MEKLSRKNWKHFKFAIFIITVICKMDLVVPTNFAPTLASYTRPPRLSPNSGSVPAATSANEKNTMSEAHHDNYLYLLDPSERFCRNVPKHPFYQRASDGAICCRGKVLSLVTIVPETTGECAISTKTDANGMLDTENLWCAYTCTLKKLGAIDRDGKVVPEVYFRHLSEGLTQDSKNRLRTVMTTHLGCFKSLKNSVSPCHTGLSFQKCFLDAIWYLCSFGAARVEDIPKIKRLALDYEKVTPACFHNRRKATPGCCHGKPMPWTVMEIMEAPINETKMNECLRTMGAQCDATCFLNSVGVVNTEMELDVSAFQNKILNYFPSVKASGWMDYLGPVFLFYDEVLADMGDESSDTPHRVCRFHDRIMELHESKVEQYCSMTQEEVKQLIKGKR